MRPAPEAESRPIRATERRAVLASRTRAPRHPARVAAVIGLVCLIMTGASTWASARVDANAEERLLQVQAKQVGAVLSTAILLIQEPLTTALSVERVTSSASDPGSFTRLMSAYVANDKLFASASLWKRKGSTIIRIAQVGAPPAMNAERSQTRAFLLDAFRTTGFVVRAVSAGSQGRIAYAEADAGTGYVVYAERAIPANRRSAVDNNSAFSELHYAIYLGRTTSAAALSTTDVDPRALPLRGTTARTTVPFGNTVLTLVVSPRHHLGASLGQRLPVILLLGGLVLSLSAALVSYQLVRRRRDAEENALTITQLFERVDGLYDEQRDRSLKLQRALLPHSNPEIPNLEIASEYVAGAQGVAIGGDWYSIIGLGDEEFGFVVGDVSGRGIDAVAVMAHARFTLRAYLLDENSPQAALEKCSRQFDVADDDHITTVVVGLGNWRTGEVTLASAGHPAPLLITDGGADYVAIAPGRPLGAGPGTYQPTVLTLTPGATLFLFTDGLVERRHEDIDIGLGRLAETVADASAQPVDRLVAHTLEALGGEDASDDIAVLAIRWEPLR